ncbi:unnamed protein product [Adineta steineri]|uniref:Uncharacterized protein n=2 Tax=Adineta steineri TaxID=433720 RepID=A0A814G6D0_9BILA|nr:unnamed protein product [Adineta steineri]CAF0990614.1 unnamed protein product [Adineta steineri]
MYCNNIASVFFTIVWLCSMGECAVLQTYINGEYKNSVSDLNCNQYNNDYDIIRQFPFPLLINPVEYAFNKSAAVMYKNNNASIQEIYIMDEEIIPASIFCLSNLEELTIISTPFQNGIIPDAIENLKQLQQLMIYESPIKKITEKLVTLPKLLTLLLSNCSLTYIQDLSKLKTLEMLELSNNYLTHINDVPALGLLKLDGNLFKEIPVIKNTDNIWFLDMNKNPLINALPILSYKNVRYIFLENATLTSIPPTIDKLQKIEYLLLTDNKISYLPTNVLNLPNLKEFSIRNNLLSSGDMKLIETAFKKSHPDLYICV